MDDELERAGRAYTRSWRRTQELRKALEEAVVRAYLAGVGTMEIASRTGQDREVIRRIRVAAEKAGRIERPSGADSPTDA